MEPRQYPSRESEGGLDGGGPLNSPDQVGGDAEDAQVGGTEEDKGVGGAGRVLRGHLRTRVGLGGRHGGGHLGSRPGLCHILGIPAAELGVGREGGAVHALHHPVIAQLPELEHVATPLVDDAVAGGDVALPFVVALDALQPVGVEAGVVRVRRQQADLVEHPLAKSGRAPVQCAQELLADQDLHPSHLQPGKEEVRSAGERTSASASIIYIP